MWSRRCSNVGVLIAVCLLQAACSTLSFSDLLPFKKAASPAASEPVAAAPTNSAPAAAAPTTTAVASTDATATAAPASPVATAPAAPAAPPPPPGALADFARAVELVKSGKDEEAELEFQEIAMAYPAYPGALVNLGILYRKHGDLAKSGQSLQSAVQRDPNDAEGWTELGVTLRQEGKFHEAADAYNQAITVNPNFAPAYRNLAIVQDLYLGDTAAALASMQHYKDLGGEDKALAGWIADLTQRAAKSAAPPQPVSPAPPAPPAPDKAGV
jgi:Flp pilus assembly protein TadD